MPLLLSGRTLPEHLLSVSLYLTENSLLVRLFVLLHCHLL